MKKLINIMAIAFLLPSCATINNGSMQSIKINPDAILQRYKVGENIRCSLKNEEGFWFVNAGESVNIHRDGNSLDVFCENAEQSGSISVPPKFNTIYLMDDIILIDGCIISCIIDAWNNSFYEYPDIIFVPMLLK